MYVAIFVDGGFVKKKWRQAHDEFPTADNVHKLCTDLIEAHFEGDELFRIFFYDCYPYAGMAYDPRAGVEVDYSDTPSARAQKNFLRELAKKPQTAIRSGELAYQGVQLHKSKLPTTGQVSRITPADLTPDFQQKQVDIKIGLDIAWTAMKGIARKIVLISGDSDLIPAMKFARKEGLLVYLSHLGHSVKFGMIEHCDGVLDMNL